MTTLAEDVKNPRRNVLLAAVIVCLFTGVFGGLLVYLAHLAWPDYTTFANVETAFIDVTGRVGGKWLFQAMAILLVVANIGAGLTSQVGAARLLFGMGRENVIPRRIFARLHPVRNTPWINILLLGILAYCGAQVMSYELTAELLNFGAFLGFMGVNAAVIWNFWFRRAHPRARNLLAGPGCPCGRFSVLRRDLAGPEPAGQDRGKPLAGGRLLCAGRPHPHVSRAHGDDRSVRLRVNKEQSTMRMKKFINDPKNLVPELLEGFALAFPAKVKLKGTGTIVRAIPKPAGKVRLVTLGGSGHEPGLSGFVGRGMLDVSVAGEIFAAPGAVKCIEALRDACAGGESALLVVLNHAGDVLAGNIAMQAAEREGLKVKMVLTEEDISGPIGDRRGLVGCVAVYKVAGAAAENGASLDACVEMAQRMADNMRTLAVAVRTATHPATGQPIFELGDDEMEIGMGQHGEAGTGRMQLKSANETAEIMLEKLLADLKVTAGEELLVLLNGAGATTLMELYLIFRRVAQVLECEEDPAGAQRYRGVHYHAGAGGLSDDDCAHGRGIDRTLGCAGRRAVLCKVMSDVICISD